MVLTKPLVITIPTLDKLSLFAVKHYTLLPMAKLIQKLKSLFKTEEAPAKGKQSAKATPAKKKVKKKLSGLGVDVEFKKIKEGIEENGCYNITVGSLFKKFGVQKRHESNIAKVNAYLEKEGLYMSPCISLKTKWDAVIRINKFPEETGSDLFKSEAEMERLFKEHKWNEHETLNLIVEEGDNQFKPKGTRDRLDFKARDAKGNLVVLELKHKDGDKRLVEQVFRYRSLLKTTFPGEKVRCIIITGNRCVHTARAIHGLSTKKQKKITWYLYNWKESNSSKIDFESVTLDFINSHLAPIENGGTGTQEVQ